MTDTLERPGGQVRYSAPHPGADCPARWHRTASAARRFGCVCPPAVQAYEAELARKRVPGGTGRGREGRPRTDLAGIAGIRFWTPQRKVAAGLDPRDTWRGLQCRVDELTVDFLVAGYTFAGAPPTKREYQVAAWRLAAQGWTGDRVAAWLGLDLRTVDRYGAGRREAHVERWRRRHADAVWRAWHKHGQRW
jgi:hypothetical protein